MGASSGDVRDFVLEDETGSGVAIVNVFVFLNFVLFNAELAAFGAAPGVNLSFDGEGDIVKSATYSFFYPYFEKFYFCWNRPSLIILLP